MVASHRPASRNAVRVTFPACVALSHIGCPAGGGPVSRGSGFRGSGPPLGGSLGGRSCCPQLAHARACSLQRLGDGNGWSAGWSAGGSDGRSVGLWQGRPERRTVGLMCGHGRSRGRSVGRMVCRTKGWARGRSGGRSVRGTVRRSSRQALRRPDATASGCCAATTARGCSPTLVMLWNLARPPMCRDIGGRPLTPGRSGPFSVTSSAQPPCPSFLSAMVGRSCCPAVANTGSATSGGICYNKLAPVLSSGVASSYASSLHGSAVDVCSLPLRRYDLGDVIAQGGCACFSGDSAQSPQGGRLRWSHHWLRPPTHLIGACRRRRCRRATLDARPNTAVHSSD